MLIIFEFSLKQIAFSHSLSLLPVDFKGMKCKFDGEADLHAQFASFIFIYQLVRRKKPVFSRQPFLSVLWSREVCSSSNRQSIGVQC